MTAQTGKSYKEYLNQLEVTLDEYLVKKAPALPEGIKEFLVKIAPWCTLIMLIIAIPAILAVLGLGAIVAPFTMFGGAAYAVSYGINYILAAVVSLVSLVLEALAVPGLFSRSRKAWNLVFYASLINIVVNLLQIQIGSALIGGLIGLYVLFQVKEYYK